MDFALSEEQRMLQDSVSGYLTANCELQRVRDAAEAGSTHDVGLAQGLAELGVTGLLIPEEFGGVQLGYLEATLVAESMGYVAAPVSFIASNIMAPVALLLAGSDDQKESLLPALAAGESTVGMAVSTATGARDSDVPSCTDGTLSGSAMFALDAEGAAAFIISDGDGALYLVDAGDVDSTKLKTIDRTRGTARLNLDQCPAQPLPGSVGNTEVLNKVIDVGRVMLAADTLGAAQKMLDDSIAYAKERKQFNRVIGSFQAVKHMCAEMAAQLEPCRSLLWYAGHAHDAIPDEARLLSCHSKAHLSETGKFVARTATEVHGGMGMTDLLGLHYWFKRIGLNRQLLGTPERVRHEAAVLQGWA